MLSKPTLILFLACPTLVLAQEDLVLVSFSNDADQYPWELVNDPVMGGVSESNYTIINDGAGTGYMAWSGEVENVPSLAAPGFCKVMTHGVHAAFPDISNFTHLTVTVKCHTPYSGYKIDFSTLAHPNFSFGSYKADFPADFNSTSCTGESFTTVKIPFTSFSNDWSGYTGEPIHTCAEDPQYCPTPKDLATVTQLSFWAEGVAGSFEVDLQAIGAANA